MRLPTSLFFTFIHHRWILSNIEPRYTYDVLGNLMEPGLLPHLPSPSSPLELTETSLASHGDPEQVAHQHVYRVAAAPHSGPCRELQLR